MNKSIVIMQEKSNSVYASFILWGKDLKPDEVAHILGILPTKSFQRGDIRIGNKTWPHGFWELASSNYVSSTDLLPHLEWIISQIEQVKEQIQQMIKDGNVTAKISCFLILPGGHDGLIFTPLLLSSISSLGIKLELDIYGDAQTENLKIKR